MTVGNVFYSEKEPAAKALLESCKGVKSKSTGLSVGEYMGFRMSLRYDSFGQQINLLLRAAMTYQIELGSDALGNITRIKNALDKLPERLSSAKSTLENLNKQVDAAKLELNKPFGQEAELQEKETRLALLNADLKIDGDGGFDILNDTDSRGDQDDTGLVEPVSDVDEETGQSSELTTDDVRSYYDFANKRDSQTASAKSKPSILDSIRSFDSGKHNSAPDNIKLEERNI
jgi:hypothetical protein